jgi:hypothetical protein
MRLHKSILIGAALAALSLTARAQTKPDFTGTWQMRESAAPTGGPREIVFVIEHKEPRFKYSATGKLGYQSFSEAYEFTTDGKAPADPSRVSVVGHWEGQTLAMSFVKDGKELAKFTYSLSPDARQMTREGGPGRTHEVYDRK